jgi:hypothetical protein
MEVNHRKICNLVVDFLVSNNDGSFEYLEVKGFPTPAWRLKQKLFHALYPQFKLTVVK